LGGAHSTSRDADCAANHYGIHSLLQETIITTRAGIGPARKAHRRHAGKPAMHCTNRGGITTSGNWGVRLGVKWTRNASRRFDGPRGPKVAIWETQPRGVEVLGSLL